MDLIGTALALNQAYGNIGGGMPTTQGEPADVVQSRAQQRIHDLGGGTTGDFDVSLGGKYNHWVYLGIIGIAILFLGVPKLRK